MNVLYQPEEMIQTTLYGAYTVHVCVLVCVLAFTEHMHMYFFFPGVVQNVVDGANTKDG